MKKDSNKKNKLTKIVCASVLAASAISLSGCEVYYARRTYPRTYYFRNSYPSHLRGTLLDPYPPGRRGYNPGIRIIRPRQPRRISPRRPFRNSLYGEHYRPRVQPHSRP